ncbi:hypothetical protein ACU686_19025 [Yinghuangia aomiensis]
MKDERRHPRPLDADTAATYASWFKALADPTRVRLVNLLAVERRPMRRRRDRRALRGRAVHRLAPPQAARRRAVRHRRATRHLRVLPGERELPVPLPDCRRRRHGSPRPDPVGRALRGDDMSDENPDTADVIATIRNRYAAAATRAAAGKPSSIRAPAVSSVPDSTTPTTSSRPPPPRRRPASDAAIRSPSPTCTKARPFSTSGRAPDSTCSCPRAGSDPPDARSAWT